MGKTRNQDKSTLRNGKTLHKPTKPTKPTKPQTGSDPTGIFKSKSTLTPEEKKLQRQRIDNIEKTMKKRLPDLLLESNRPKNTTNKSASYEPAIVYGINWLAMKTGNAERFNQQLRQAIYKRTGDENNEAIFEDFLLAANIDSAEAGRFLGLFFTDNTLLVPFEGGFGAPHPASYNPIAPASHDRNFLPVYHRLSGFGGDFDHLLNIPPTAEELSLPRDRLLDAFVEHYRMGQELIEQDPIENLHLRNDLTCLASCIKFREQWIIARGGAGKYYARYWDEEY